MQRFVVAGIAGVVPAAAVAWVPTTERLLWMLTFLGTTLGAGALAFLLFRIPSARLEARKEAVFTVGGYREAIRMPLGFPLIIAGVVMANVSPPGGGTAITVAAVAGAAAILYATPVAMTLTHFDKAGITQWAGFRRPTSVRWAHITKVVWAERVIRGPKGVPILITGIDFYDRGKPGFFLYSMAMSTKHLALAWEQVKVQLADRPEVVFEDTRSVSAAVTLGMRVRPPTVATYTAATAPKKG